MQISGNSPSQASSADSLKAYDQVSQVKRQDISRQEAEQLLAAQQAQAAQQLNNTQSSSQNQPVPGASVGSVINTSA